MPTAQTAPDADIEKIDAILEQEQSVRTDKARAAVRARLVEEERLAGLASEEAAARSARAAYLKRVAALHGPACARYKVAVDEFRAARIQLYALDTILD